MLLRARVSVSCTDPGPWPAACRIPSRQVVLLQEVAAGIDVHKDMTAPRGALLYSRFSREEFGGRFLGLMPYLNPKGAGTSSMAGN